MIILIWAALLSSVRGSSAETGAPAEKQSCEHYGYCVTLTEGELTAEAGLCVVIPCSFTTGYGFTPQNIVWYKCEPSYQQCDDSDVIFHPNKNNRKVKFAFRGRVSLLEPDVSQNNCGIIINDLRESDSGLYQLRVNGELNGRPDRYTFNRRVTVSVRGLTQKPSVTIPSLTEGQKTTLTCTAPGLCSGTYPKISWTWRGAGGNDSYITGSITELKMESLSAVMKRHISTLTFTSSAELHGTNITCKVNLKGVKTTKETLTLNVNYVRKVQITGDTSVKEGETLNLTCSVESFPPSVITWTKATDENMQNWTVPTLQNINLTDLPNNTEAYLQEKSGMSFFTISNVTVEDSGQYICTAKHLNNTLEEKVSLTVIYKRKPRITGDTTLKEGDILNLTCSMESYPPSQITWRKRPTQHNTSSDTQLHNGTDADLCSDTGSATLIIPDVAAGDSGQYECTAKHLNTTVTVYADVTMTWFSMIQNGSECMVDSEVLTCVCKSEGFPLPTIQWPLLKKHTDYSVITIVSNHMVSSTLTVKNLGTKAIECVSSNGNMQATKNLPIQIKPKPDDNSRQLSKIVIRLEMIVAFLTGILLSAIICCLAQKCWRKKQKPSGNLEETLEMVTSQDDPLISNGPAVQDDLNHTQEGAENGAVAAEKAAPEHNSGPKDVEYASINFSLLRRKSPRGAARKQESTETEYAEIKKQVKEVCEDDDGEEGEMLESKEEEDVVMEEDEETKPCVAEEEEREEEAVYSSVKDIMDEI